ncbi:nitrogen regulation protein NR(II) [Desulfitobacterium sp. PCE1]|uniref:two-component system sensor histidine kinase NtrB n=1 Tax=Desulfitobacterium sp. PCE1 TaxID=146907 RepID=UPI00036DAB7D|nr:PAS domain S-box protein [Desulfitobacterium sp. PCE1]
MRTKLPEDYEVVFDFAAIGMALLSLDEEFLKVNTNFHEFFGYNGNEFAEMTFTELVHHEDSSMVIEEIKKLLSGQIPTFHLESRFLHKSGEIKWGLFSFSLVRDGKGDPLYAIVQIQDITSRKRMEDDLSYRVEFERFVTTMSTRFINCPVDKIDEEIISALEKIGQFLKAGRIFIDHPSGITPSSTQELAEPFSDEDSRLIKIVGEVIFSAIQRKQTEIARQNSEQLISAAFAGSPALMMILSIEGRGVIDVNKTFIEALGYDRNELLNINIDELSSLVRPSDYERIYECLSQYGSVLNREIEMITKSGAKRKGLFSAEKIMIGNQMCLLLVSQDITEKKRLEKEMVRLERLNLIGQMAAGIGHEIRNPMTTVRGYLQYLSKKDKYSDQVETFQLMIEELDRANEIITEYLFLSQDRVVDFKRLNLNTIIHHLYPLLSVHTKIEDMNIKLNLGSIPDLYLDEKELRQLILNLARNGLEAMSAKGTLTIATYSQQGNVILEVEDQGTGIPNDIKDKIGTPFFTTKLNGTGLGMAICYSIAARHNATIGFQSSPQGTKVRVKFQGCRGVS